MDIEALVRVFLVVVLAGGWMVVGLWIGWCAGWKAGKKHAARVLEGKGYSWLNN